MAEFSREIRSRVGGLLNDGVTSAAKVHRGYTPAARWPRRPYNFSLYSRKSTEPLRAHNGQAQRLPRPSARHAFGRRLLAVLHPLTCFVGKRERSSRLEEALFELHAPLHAWFEKSRLRNPNAGAQRSGHHMPLWSGHPKKEKPRRVQHLTQSTKSRRQQGPPCPTRTPPHGVFAYVSSVNDS